MVSGRSSSGGVVPMGPEEKGSGVVQPMIVAGRHAYLSATKAHRDGSADMVRLAELVGTRGV